MQQAQVLDKLVRRESGKYGSTDNKRLLVFIDDVQLADKDPFKATPVHEVIREAIQRKSW